MCAYHFQTQYSFHELLNPSAAHQVHANLMHQQQHVDHRPSSLRSPSHSRVVDSNIFEKPRQNAMDFTDNDTKATTTLQHDNEPTSASCRDDNDNSPNNDHDHLERVRQSYLASLDASIDLLVRNSIAFPSNIGFVGACTSPSLNVATLSAFSTSAPPFHSESQSSQLHHPHTQLQQETQHQNHYWHRPQINEDYAPVAHNVVDTKPIAVALSSAASTSTPTFSISMRSSQFTIENLIRKDV